MRLRRGIVQKSSFRNNLSSAGAISQRIIPVHLNPIRAIVVPSFRLLYNFPQQPLAFQRNLRDSTRSTKKRVKINKRLIFTIVCTTTYVTLPVRTTIASVAIPSNKAVRSRNISRPVLINFDNKRGVWFALHRDIALD